MPRVNINGDDIYYAIRGTSSPAIVFVHGAGGDHLVWNGQLAAVADLATGYGIDLPGHGRSTGAGRDSIERYSDVVVAFLDAVQVKSAIIVGHSMGGGIALKMALTHPQRVMGLGLVGTGGRLRVLPQILNGVLLDFQATAKMLNLNSFSDTADPSLVSAGEQNVLANSPAVLKEDFVACDRFDVMDRLSEIRIPTLVICGKQDKMTPLKYSEFLVSKIPGARLVTVEGAGHNVMIERPASVNQALLDWIKAL